MVKAMTTREWEAVRHFRQFYFFDKVGSSDPYAWTFEDPKHIHFILYHVSEIIGYAHIQLWPKQRAALRIIVIDERKRNHQYKRQFLALCEKWLKSQGNKRLFKFFCVKKLQGRCLFTWIFNLQGKVRFECRLD